MKPRHLIVATVAVALAVPTLAMVLKDAPGKYALVKGIGADNWADYGNVATADWGDRAGEL